MVATIAEARGQERAPMHCPRGHRFTLAASYRDAYGTWCPECGNGAHSYEQTGCPLCIQNAHADGEHKAGKAAGCSYCERGQ
jgi:hypothetical protein